MGRLLAALLTGFIAQATENRLIVTLGLFLKKVVLGVALLGVSLGLFTAGVFGLLVSLFVWLSGQPEFIYPALVAGLIGIIIALSVASVAVRMFRSDYS